jgi:uncharacterized protein (TIGR02001 family)
MKNVVLSAVAVSAAFIAAPVFAADMPVKAKPVVAAPAPSQWDVLFGVAFTSDYILRGVSQSAHKPAVQGYTELDFKPADWLTLYTGVWGSSLYSSFANAEFDITAGARFSWGNFGLDVGVVNYQYPDSTANGFGDYTEFYAKPSYKFADWLTVGAIVDGGNDFNNKYNIAGPWLGNGNAGYYSANAVITLPWHPVADVNLSINPEFRYQLQGPHARPSLLGHEHQRLGRQRRQRGLLRRRRRQRGQGRLRRQVRRHAQARHGPLGDQVRRLRIRA